MDPRRKSLRKAKEVDYTGKDDVKTDMHLHEHIFQKKKKQQSKGGNKSSKKKSKAASTEDKSSPKPGKSKADTAVVTDEAPKHVHTANTSQTEVKVQNDENLMTDDGPKDSTTAVMSVDPTTVPSKPKSKAAKSKKGQLPLTESNKSNNAQDVTMAESAVNQPEEESTSTTSKESKRISKKRPREPETTETSTTSKETGDNEASESSPPKRQKSSKADHKASGAIDSVASGSSRQHMQTDISTQDTVNELIVQKDAAYDVLMGKYKALKNERKDEQDKLVNKLLHSHAEDKKAADNLISQLKAEKDALTVQLQGVKSPNTLRQESKVREEATQERDTLRTEVTSLQEKVRLLETQLAEKQTALEAMTVSSQEGGKQIETYQLLTGARVALLKGRPGTIRCTAVSRVSGKRMLEFDLTTEGSEQEEITYTPRKIDLGGIDYPQWMKDSISFQPDQTPMFMKNVLDAVNKPVDATGRSGSSGFA